VVRKSQISKIDELARFVHPHDGHQKVFAMIEAYIDESGIHGDATVCVVAGYFGRRNHWNHFESAWRKVLHHFDFALADFHAKDQIKQPKYHPMLMELARTVSKYQIYPVSMVLAVDDFKSFPHDLKRWLTGGSFRNGKLVSSGAPSKPYFVPFQLLIQRVTDYAKAGSKAHFFCGLDKQFSEYARALFAKIKIEPSRPYSAWESKPRLGDIAFPMASETPELQAADMFAHLTYLHMLERMKQKKTLKDVSLKPGGMLALCLKNSRSKWDNACQDRDSLIATFEKARQLQIKRSREG
jgi:Protein of unknown function (DUF3800)